MGFSSMPTHVGSDIMSRSSGFRREWFHAGLRALPLRRILAARTMRSDDSCSVHPPDRVRDVMRALGDAHGRQRDGQSSCGRDGRRLRRHDPSCARRAEVRHQGELRRSMRRDPRTPSGGDSEGFRHGERPVHGRASSATPQSLFEALSIPAYLKGNRDTLQLAADPVV